MEAIVQPVTWGQWSPATRTFFERLRSPAGERMILEENLFVEWLLPQRVQRTLTAAEMEIYRRPFLLPGESRRPTLTWPRQFPIEGEPADVVAIVRANGAWLASSPIPKLLIVADPGTISADEVALCRGWPNTTKAAVKGLHFIQEDSPAEIAEALVRWLTSLVAKTTDRH